MSQPEQHYMPGLDGLRALAVVLVLVFHADLGWLPGGFVGVSLFFTLSGFLITRVIVKELEQHQSLSLRRFWAKRVRRLAPASIACFAAVCIWALSSSSAQTGPGLRFDALAALGNVANWRFALTGKSYAELFAGPSPLLHAWSLSIEEQFYLIFPLLMVLLWKLGLRRRGCALVLGSLTALSVLVAYLTDSDDLAYYGTHTRSGEVFVGAVLALLSAKGLAVRRPAARRAFAAVLAMALVVVAVIARRADPNTHALIHGGLGLLSLASAVLIIGAIVPGRLRTMLSVAPLRAIGRISYGIYLYHWPIFLWIKSTRWGNRGVVSFGIAVGLTMLVSVASARWLEQPVRQQQWPRIGARARLGYVGAMVVVALLAASVSSQSTLTTAFAKPGGPASVVTFAPAPTTSPALGTAPPITLAPSPPTRVLVLGSDLTLGDRVAMVVAEAPIEVIDRSSRSCSAFATGAVADESGALVVRDCSRQRWENLIASTQPDAVLVGLSDLERRSYELFDGTAVSSDLSNVTLRKAALAEVVGFLADLDIPAYISDAQGADLDALTISLQSLLRRSPSVTRVVVAEIGSLVDDLQSINTKPGSAKANLRVLVVGDSTAYALAEGLSVGSDGALSVVSAGVIQCPIVHAEQVLSGPGVAETTDHCLWYDTDWPRLVQAYDIDVIFAVDSLAEQWDQKYPGGEQWSIPGDDAYNAFHDAQLGLIEQTLNDLGVPLLIADSPALGRDIGPFFGNDPARIEAWNTVIFGWDFASPSIKVVPYAQWFADPNSAQGRSERPDGVHVSRSFSEQMTRQHLLAALQTAYRQAIADIKRAG